MSYLHTNFAKICTKNLFLMDSLPADLEKVKDFFKNNKDVLNYSSWQDIYQQDEGISFFEKSLRTQFEYPRKSFILGIISNNNPAEMIGVCSLCVTEEKKEGIIRLALARNIQGLFYSLEVIEGLLEFGFQVLNFNKITSLVDNDNEILRKIYLRANMQEDGMMREYLFYGNKWHDQYLFSMLRREWLELKKR